MSNDPASRRLLPQSSQMNNFSFAPPVYQQPPRETQKNYVFVDEHNRHKRLKVMRACEGCRRRKIKCDAATTNTWPCSACIRLKLHCVRPNGYDGSPTDGQIYETSGYEAATQMPEGYQQQMSMPQQSQQMMANSQKSQPPIYCPQPQQPYADTTGIYQQVQYSNPPSDLQYTGVPPPMSLVDQNYAAQNVFPTPPLQSSSSQPDSPPSSYTQEQYAQADLADLLGELKMNEAGSAPYLNSKMRAKIGMDEEPIVGDDDDYKSHLPPLVSGPGLKIRIPPELMPDDETAVHYFDLYFAHVHPYVPVLDKSLFFHQWQTNREAISPLLLEAMLAIGGRLDDDPAQGQQWLALASRHADSFMDVPRLSTLQALLIVLKAREAAPKRGYYYRSWMAVVQCVQMGKDLGLDEHHAEHKAGNPCGSSPAECLMKTRIWQTIFCCECMIGSPQGRTDLAVDVGSVDFSVPRAVPGLDESEYHVSRNFSYFARVVRNVSVLNRVYGGVKKNKDWQSDPQLTQLNPSFDAWQNELPQDLTVSFSPDGSPPWLPSPFIGNLHSYYHLTIIMLHRPQLQVLNPNGADGQWKHHMLICYESAKRLCCLEEAILQSFGLVGLQCMQRGVNFTIYAVLTCIVLHLVAITSPDPDLNSDAREYFTRHMRILEKCMSAWPMPDMQKQIDAVREAFSADIRKPFVLKPSFPYGSPPPAAHISPLQQDTGFQQGLSRHSPMENSLDGALQSSHVSYTSHPISPPISAGPVDMKSDHSSLDQSLAMMASQGPAMQQSLSLSDAPAWNPSRIFEQWNSTFGTPQVQSQPASVPPQTNSLSVSPSSGASEIPTIQDIQAVQSTLPAGMPTSSLPTYTAAPLQTFVTPAMWQESVASVYEGGLKRAWDYDLNMPVAKRR